MDLEAKAPLCTHFLETLAGITTVRAFGWSERYARKNNELLSESQAPFYLLSTIQNWLKLVLDLMVAGLVSDSVLQFLRLIFLRYNYEAYRKPQCRDKKTDSNSTFISLQVIECSLTNLSDYSNRGIGRRLETESRPWFPRPRACEFDGLG